MSALRSMVLPGQLPSIRAVMPESQISRGESPMEEKAFHDIFSGSGQVFPCFGMLVQVAAVLLHLVFEFLCSS